LPELKSILLQYFLLVFYLLQWYIIVVKKEDNKYFVLMADVFDSSNQSGVQKKLHDAVSHINQKKDTTWKTFFEITRGDEVAVIVDKTCGWFKVMRSFSDIVRPFQLRWVVIYDEIREGLSSESSAEATGPAFVIADQQMHELKKTSLYASIRTGYENIDQQLAGIVNLFLERLNKFSKLQLDTIREYQHSRRQKTVAKKLGKTQQQIQQTLKSVNFQTIDLAEKAIDLLVETMNNKLR